MLTFENIVLNEQDEVVISFTYEGNNIQFNGEIKTTQEQFINSVNAGDEYLIEFVENTLQQELDLWIKQYSE